MKFASLKRNGIEKNWVLIDLGKRFCIAFQRCKLRTCTIRAISPNDKNVFPIFTCGKYGF